MSNESNSLIEGKIFPTLIKFALPFLGVSLLQALYGAADLLIVGQFSNSEGISAVAIGSQVMQTITGIVLGLTTGGTILLGQFLGAKKDEDMAETIGNMIWLFSILAIILTVLMLIFTGNIVKLMNTPKESFVFTKQYLFICSCGIPFIIGYNAVSGVFRGFGDSKKPFIFVAIACVINITLDLVFVAIFHMGAAGAAAATIIAQGVSFILAIIFLRKRGFEFSFNKKHITFKKDKYLKILQFGAPIALQDGLINVSFLIITIIINTMGVTASASLGVVEKILGFAMLPPGAFSAAIAVMTAQNIGAGKKERAKSVLYKGIQCSLVFGIAVWGYCQITPENITRIFTSDTAVIEASALYLKSFSLDCVLVCYVFCMNAFFSGCGHSSFAMIHSLLATFGIRIPVSFLLSNTVEVSLYTMGFAAPSASILSILMCFIYMKSRRWEKSAI